MVSSLKEYFVNDDSKNHYLTDDAETAQERKQKRGELIVVLMSRELVNSMLMMNMIVKKPLL